MCDGTLLPPLVLSLLLLVWGLDPGTVVGDAAADVEVVLPRRLRPDDVHLQLLPGAAGLRQWRRPRASPGDPRAGPGERALLLHLPAFGRDLYLQLRRDLRFLSPGFEVEEAGVSGRSGHPAELCFYSGQVLGHPGSLVSLSACGAAGGLGAPKESTWLADGLPPKRLASLRACDVSNCSPISCHSRYLWDSGF
uniref:A disintegrin and metalloproteinase with thrombospondin motifs 17 isoform 3 precursor n=1 Tax=Rattus norvegicus TaxID=10116 RepID=UPI00349EF4F5